MIELNSIGVVTCYAVIIAMAVVVLKAFQHPLIGIINAFNPFLRNRQMGNLMERINELEMNKYSYEDDIRQIKAKIKELEKTTKVSRVKK